MRTLLKIVAVLLVIVVLAAVVGVFAIDGVAASRVEQSASRALGVETEVGSLHIGLLSADLEVGAVRVNNPEGFAADDFLRLEHGETAVTPASLLEDQVVLPFLRLRDLEMNLERAGGRANYQVIIDNIKAYESGKAPPKDGEAQTRFVIREVTIESVLVHVNLLPEGGAMTKLDVPIDLITLEDVGSESDRGVLLADLTSVIIKAVIAAVVAKGGALPPDLLADLTGQLAGLEVLTNIEGQVEEITGAAEEIGRDLEKQAGDLLRGIGGKKEE